MAKHRVSLTHRKHRSILTDMLPFEVPPTFSNKGFYSFLRRIELDHRAKTITWIADDDRFDLTIKLLFGLPATTPVTTTPLRQWGSLKNTRSVTYRDRDIASTSPFNFNVAHNLDGRILSVVHPRNQISVASFYATFCSLITYYSSKSDFSIRRPVSVARYAYFKDKLHDQRLEVSKGVEQDDHEYEQLGSYFVYKKFSNIHKFFESDDYHRCEKKYRTLLRADVSKCFDSIYTHSIAWAVLGKDQTKFNLAESTQTFAGIFDKLMQRLNYNETNGIVIGPEFSRIFAEIILQSVDCTLKRRLEKDFRLCCGVDYEIFRYVDDYFIFYNEAQNREIIVEVLQGALKEKKLNINSSKLKSYERPIITEVTIAKERISSLLNSALASSSIAIEPDVSEKKKLACHIDKNSLIVQYKTILKETDVTYSDLLNYTFSIVENKVERLLKSYLETEKSTQDKKKLISALLSVTEFMFFGYAASPKVNHTIRVCRMMSTAVTFLNREAVNYELKHLLFKAFHDNIVLQIDRNSMDKHREIETLYLLLSLSQIGKEYWLPESVLVKYFSISVGQDGNYEREDFLNFFSITVLLAYMRGKVRYLKLREFIEEHALKKLKNLQVHWPHNTESLLLFFDLISCPFVSDHTQQLASAIFQIDAAGLAKLKASNNRWFTTWGDDFDIGKALDEKRSREVY